jgi:hypothetical protein
VSNARKEKIRTALQAFKKLNNRFREKKKKYGYDEAKKLEGKMALAALRLLRIMGNRGIRELEEALCGH